jgi:hypothetical protein
MRSLLSVLATLTFAGFAAAPACSGEEVATVPKQGTSTSGSTSGGSTTSGAPCTGLGGCSKVSDPVAVCAFKTTNTMILPLHMVLSVDISGSMCETGDNSGKNCDNPTSKWQQAKAGLDAYATDPTSKGVSVTLIPWSGNTCGDFSTPKLGVTELPSGAVKSTLDGISPTSATPTSAALSGALAHAQVLKGMADGKKTIIVFVTDGLPTACPGDGTEETPAAFDAAIAAATKVKDAKVPLYVLGVGNQLSKLDEIANAGGQPDATGRVPQAIAIPLSDPGSVRTGIIKELKRIRGGDVYCDAAIPLPPDKKGLDYFQARVKLVENGNETTLQYSEKCDIKDGWRYDRVPTMSTGANSIKLCDESCGSVLKSGQKSIKVEFGCKTDGPSN